MACVDALREAYGSKFNDALLVKDGSKVLESHFCSRNTLCARLGFSAQSLAPFRSAGETLCAQPPGRSLGLENLSLGEDSRTDK